MSQLSVSERVEIHITDWPKESHNLIIAPFKVDEFYPSLVPVFNNGIKVSIESSYLSCLIFR